MTTGTSAKTGAQGSAPDYKITKFNSVLARGADTSWVDLMPTEKKPGTKLDPMMREELIMYGELLQASYDGFISTIWSTRFGEPRCLPFDMLDDCLLKTSLGRRYKIEGGTNDLLNPNYIYTGTGPYGVTEEEKRSPECMAKSGTVFHQSKVVKGLVDDEQTWIGYVAVSEPNSDGKRDIVVALRGTSTTPEWGANILGNLLTLWEEGKPSLGKVHMGFKDIYRGKPGDAIKPEQTVRDAVEALLNAYPGEVGSITTTGHSLGAALATLAAFDLAEKLSETRYAGLQVRTITWASPRVGDPVFAEELKRRGVKALRISNTRDMVCQVPGVFNSAGLALFRAMGVPVATNDWLEKGLTGMNRAMGAVPLLGQWNYQHVGEALLFDSYHLESDTKKDWRGNVLLEKVGPLRDLGAVKDQGPRHNLEVYIYMMAVLHTEKDKEDLLARNPILMNKRENAVNPAWLAAQVEHGFPPDMLDPPGNWWLPLAAPYYINRRKELYPSTPKDK